MVIMLVVHVHPAVKAERPQFVSAYIVIESSPRATAPARNAAQTASMRSSALAANERKVTDSVPTMPFAPQLTDWQAERERATDEWVAHGLEEGNSSLLSKPYVIGRPKNGTQYQPEESHRFDGGEVIAWISEDCYATNLPPPGPQLDPNRLNVICKRKKPPQGGLFDHLKPNYLRGPDDAPLPKFKDEAQCERSTLRCD